MDKISIIVPIYNSEKYLEKCLNSLVNQTYKNLEIILVNDGSTDSSKLIVNAFLEKYSNIVYIEKENGGQASARNIGVKKATGKYISFIDSDDYVEINMYKQLSKFLKNDIDILIFGFHQINGNVDIINNGYLNYSGDCLKNYILSPAGPWNKIFKKSIWTDNKIKFLENKIYEDLAIIPAIACYASNIAMVDYKPYFYIIHDNSTMRQKIYNKKLLDIFPAVENLKKEFIINNKFELYFDEIEFIYIENLLHGASLRFLDYDAGENDINTIIKIMKEEFPNWKGNKYYKKQGWKYKIICNLIYKNKVKIAKKFLRK